MQLRQLCTDRLCVRPVEKPQCGSPSMPRPKCILVVQHAVSRAVQHHMLARRASDYIFDSFRKDRPPAKILGPKIWNRSKSLEDGRMLYAEPQPYGDQMTIADLPWVAGVDLNVEYPDRQNPENRSFERYDGAIRVRDYEGGLTPN